MPRMPRRVYTRAHANTDTDTHAQFHHERLIEAQFQVGMRRFKVFSFYGYTNGSRDEVAELFSVMRQYCEIEQGVLQLWMGDANAHIGTDTAADGVHFWGRASGAGDAGDGQEMGRFHHFDFLVPSVPPPDCMATPYGAVVRARLHAVHTGGPTSSASGAFFCATHAGAAISDHMARSASGSSSTGRRSARTKSCR